MKHRTKWIALLLVLALAAGLTGCAGTETAAASDAAKPQQTQTEAPSQSTPAQTEAQQPEQASRSETEAEPAAAKSSILVVYFSRTGEQYNVGVIEEGNTAIVAKAIAAQTGADLYEILPETDDYPYTYSELTDVAKKEQNENARPAIRDALPELSQYDTVFIGAPVWWGDWPMILYTFFESTELSGKTMIPFSTHEGSGLSGFDRKLASVCPSSTVLDGLAIRGSDCQNDRPGVESKVRDWLDDLGY